MIVGGDDECIKLLSNISSFSLCAMISPGISPALQLINEGLTRLKAEIIKDDGLVLLIAAPPLIIFFEVGIGIFIPYGSGFACTSLSIMPFYGLRVGARGNFDIIFLYFADA